LKTLLFILSVLAGLAGAAIFTKAENAMHEIEALILFAMATVLLAGSSIVEAVDGLRADIKKSRSSILRD